MTFGERAAQQRPVEHMPPRAVVDQRRPRSLPIWLTLALVVAALALLQAPRGAGQNFQPRPDALEYAVLAHRLADGQTPNLPMGDRQYLSRYPVGFPLLLAPAVRAGLPPHALWIETALLSLVGVAMTFLAAAHWSTPGIAAWAAVIAALSPLQLQYATSLMSDAPTAAAIGAWAVLVARGRRGATLGLLSGLTCSMHLMELPLLGVGLTAALLTDRRTAARFSIGTFVGLTPIWLPMLLGHGGFSAGYAYWGPEFYGTARSTFVSSGATHRLSEYVRVLLGISPRFYALPVSLLAALGMVAAWRSRHRDVAALLGATIALRFSMAVAYFFFSVRLLLPILPLVAVLAALGLEVVAQRTRLLAVGLAVAHGHAAESSVGPLLTQVARKLPPDALIVSDVAAPLAWLYWIRGTRREFMPLAIPPIGIRGNLIDGHLRTLRRMITNHVDRNLPTLLLDDGHVTDAADATLTRAATAVVVTCTPFGTRMLADVPGLRLDIIETSERCRLATLRLAERPETHG